VSLVPNPVPLSYSVRKSSLELSCPVG